MPLRLRAINGPEHSQQSTCAETLLDDLVGAGEQRGRHGQTKRLRRFYVNDQIELCGLLYRQIRWVRTLQDLIDVVGSVSLETRRTSQMRLNRRPRP